jgi:hypothetical protein
VRDVLEIFVEIILAIMGAVFFGDPEVVCPFNLKTRNLASSGPTARTQWPEPEGI